MEQLFNYIRLGSFEEGYLKYCCLYGTLLEVNNDWYWYMRAYYHSLIDKYIYMKSGCLYLETGVEVLEWDDELGVYRHIPDVKDVVGNYNGTAI